MANVYKVQSNGKAPQGLKPGDMVVTGGGTYMVEALDKKNGGYVSRMIDRQTNTDNYPGAYTNASTGQLEQTAAAIAESVYTPSGGSVSGNGNVFSRIGSRKKNGVISGESSGVSGGVSGGVSNTAMSFDDAVKLAGQVMEPQYAAKYQQAADEAGQKLDKAGLYTTMYGQALSASAQNEVSRDLNAAVYELALKLMQADQETSLAQRKLAQTDAENALAQRKLNVQESQFGANYTLDKYMAMAEALYKSGSLNR